MARFVVGDRVRVDLPKGKNKRGVVGISVLYSTSPEARFDGASGDVAEIDPRGPYGIPLYRINFRDHDNRVAIPWQSQWFREEWLATVGERPKQPLGVAGEQVAATGQGRSSTGESS